MLLEYISITQLLVLKCLLVIRVVLLLLIFTNLAFLCLLVLFTVDFFSQRIHLVLLLLHQITLRRVDLLLAGLQIRLTFFIFKRIRSCLHLMRILKVFLLAQIRLHLSKVKQLG